MTLAIRRKHVSRYIDYFPNINFLSKPRSKAKTSPGVRRGNIFVIRFYSDAFELLIHCSAALPAVPADSVQGKHLLSTSVSGDSLIAPAAYEYAIIVAASFCFPSLWEGGRLNGNSWDVILPGWNPLECKGSRSGAGRGSIFWFGFSWQPFVWAEVFEPVGKLLCKWRCVEPSLEMALLLRPLHSLPPMSGETWDVWMEGRMVGDLNARLQKSPVTKAAAVPGVVAYLKYLLLMASLSRAKPCGVEKLYLPCLTLWTVIRSLILPCREQRGGKGGGTASEWSTGGLVSFCP